jgi:hypothetical protein
MDGTCSTYEDNGTGCSDVTLFPFLKQSWLPGMYICGGMPLKFLKIRILV